MFAGIFMFPRGNSNTICTELTKPHIRLSINDLIIFTTIISYKTGPPALVYIPELILLVRESDNTSSPAAIKTVFTTRIVQFSSSYLGMFSRISYKKFINSYV